MTIIAFWRAVSARLAAGEPVFVALVVANTRGSPGTLGARALVDRQGHMQGTIGGGVMEANVLTQAREALTQAAYTPRIQRLVHRRNAGDHASGLICAGEQTHLCAVLRPDTDAPVIAQFLATLEDEQSAATTLIIDANGLRVANHGPDFERPPLRLVQDSGGWHYAEENISRRRLAIIGGGHCGQALARLAGDIGYRVDLFDIRADVLDAGTWPQATYRHALSDYAELATRLEYTALTRVVVMTTAVTQDIDALTVLAAMDCRWLGVMGSRHKIHTIRRALADRHVAAAHIDAIHGSIGLAMKSDTPTEIAVSIMGQLLAHEHDAGANTHRDAELSRSR